MKNKALSIFLLFAIIVGVLSGCSSEQGESFQRMEAFEEAKIGILTGSAHEQTAEEVFPNATRVYFSNVADMILAVEQGKIDCYIEDAPFLVPLIWEGVNLVCVDGSLAQMNNGFVFPQGKSVYLREQINTFLGEAKADGTIERLSQKWLGETEPEEQPGYSNLTGENGTIRIAISVDNKPMLYQNTDSFMGFEMELLTLFGQRYGYKFDIEVVPFESIIAGISAGKYDMGASSLNITPEREESVDFSDPYMTIDAVLVTRGDVGGTAAGGETSGKKLADFEDATIGIHTGTVYDTFARERFPDAKREYYNLISDMIAAVEQEKIDGYLSESTYVTAAIWEGAKIQSVDEAIDHTQAAYIFRKSEQSAQLREQMNSFVRAAKGNGTLDELKEK